MGSSTWKDITHGGVDMTRVMRKRFESLRQKLEQDPDNADLLVQCGTTLEGLKAKKDAVPYFKRAFQIDPSLTFLLPKINGQIVKAAAAPAPAANHNGPNGAPVETGGPIPATETEVEAESEPEAEAGPGQTEENPFLKKPPRPTRSYFMDLMLSWSYPLRTPGIYILLAGAVFLAVCRTLANFSLFFGGFIAVLAAGYMAAYYLDVIVSASFGKDEVPTWPDISDPGAIGGSLLKWWSGFLAGYAPSIVCFVMAIVVTASEVSSSSDDNRMSAAFAEYELAQQEAMENGEDPGAVPFPEMNAPAPSGTMLAVAGLWVITGFALVLFGIIYSPMALLANAISGSALTAWNPVHIIRAMIRAMPHYLQLLLMGFVLMIVFGVAEVGLYLIGAVLAASDSMGGWFLMIPVTLIVTMLEIYAWMALCRMVGLLYFHRQEQLGWYSS